MKCESKTQENNENCKGKKYNVKGGVYLVKASLHVWWKERRVKSGILGIGESEGVWM